jgi:ribosomal protein S18 acetylase RimI-like enzyme
VSAIGALTIREAEERDLDTILGLIRELAVYEKLGHEAVADREEVRGHLFGERRHAEVLIAEIGDGGGRDGEAVGFALFFHNFSTFLGKPGIYLEDLFVRTEHRGRGYGKALLSRLAAIAVERSCGRLEWSVLNWNEPAIEFYKKLGAGPMDEWTVYRLTGDALERVARGGG